MTADVKNLTQKKVSELTESFKESPLYAKSFSPFKDFQLMEFLDVDDGLLQGNILKTETIDGHKTYVTYHFTDGLIDSPKNTSGNLLPAVEYDGHYEIWKDGLIVSVHSLNEKITEEWNGGIPRNIYVQKRKSFTSE